MSLPFGFILGGMPGWLELLILALIVLLLFGNRLPSVMGSLGKSIVEFKKGLSGIEDEVDKAGKRVEDSSAKDKEITGKVERNPAKK